MYIAFSLIFIYLYISLYFSCKSLISEIDLLNKDDDDDDD